MISIQDDGILIYSFVEDNVVWGQGGRLESVYHHANLGSVPFWPLDVGEVL